MRDAHARTLVITNTMSDTWPCTLCPYGTASQLQLVFVVFINMAEL